MAAPIDAASALFSTQGHPAPWWRLCGSLVAHRVFVATDHLHTVAAAAPIEHQRFPFDHDRASGNKALRT